MSTQADGNSPPTHRGRGRGRGRGFRGRGRGRGAGSRGAHIGNRDAPQASHQRGQSRPKLTHFLSLPIGHHARLRERVSTFTSNLLSEVPLIPGLDASVVMPPRRLHLTLGMMSFGPETNNERTLAEAIAFLQQLKPRVLELLSGKDLVVSLKQVAIMPPERGDLSKAHVLWAGPSYEEVESQRLKTVSEFVHKEFVTAGFVVNDGKPLKLHCTILNTTYRKPRPQVRLPFSYSAILESAAFRTIERQSPSTAGSSNAKGRSPLPADLGEWKVDEIQICEMGSWGPQGEYVSVGACPLK